jgi:multiple sugar transport system ATP-binding protein
MVDGDKIEFRNVWKSYKDAVALHDVSCAVKEREFFVLFGPSGAGKTTTLKVIAGLEYVSRGELFLNGKFANFMRPQERNVRMAFENYSLYPHFTVFDNLASPLRVKRFSKQEITRRVGEIAGTLGITPYLKRLPRELSGGQKQRVALGRALIVESDIYLLDEPLAHLDAKIRNELRAEFQNLKSFLSKSTVVYVTHDYTEALALGERICVLQGGRIVQVDVPRKVYGEPRNVFVASLLGQPRINLLKSEIHSADGVYTLRKEGFVFTCPPRLHARLTSYGKKEVILGFRPHEIDFRLDPPGEPDGWLAADVQAFEIRNYKGIILARVGEQQVTIQCEEYQDIREKSRLWMRPVADKVYLFDAETEMNLLAVGPGE